MMKIEDVSALEALNDAAKLLGGDLVECVGRDLGADLIGVASDHRSYGRGDDEFVVGEVNLCGPHAAERPLVGDAGIRAVDQFEDGEPDLGSGGAQRFSKYSFSVRDGDSPKAEVEVRRVSKVLVEAKAKRGTPFEDQALGCGQATKRFDDVRQDVVPFDGYRRDAV
jgi:hypothetical protein